MRPTALRTPRQAGSRAVAERERLVDEPVDAGDERRVVQVVPEVGAGRGDEPLPVKQAYPRMARKMR